MDDVIAYNPWATVLDNRVLLRKVKQVHSRTECVIEINIRPNVIDYNTPGFYNTYSVDIPVIIEHERATIADEKITLVVRAFEVLSRENSTTEQRERIILLQLFANVEMTDLITFFNGRYNMHTFMIYERTNTRQPYPFIVTPQPMYHPDFVHPYRAFAIMDMLFVLIEEHQPGILLK